MIFHIEFACSHASKYIRIHSRETIPTHCAALLVRDCMNTIYLRYRIGKYPDSPSTRYRIRCGFSSVSPLWKADSKLSGFATSFRGRRPYPERKVAESKISEYLWTRSEKTPSQNRISNLPAKFAIV